MIQNVLSSIGGVGMYGVISILIFVAVFVVVTIWMLCLKKPYLESMRTLPLDEDTRVKPRETDPKPSDL